MMKWGKFSHLPSVRIILLVDQSMQQFTSVDIPDNNMTIPKSYKYKRKLFKVLTLILRYLNIENSAE